VSYTLTILAAVKRDAEHGLYQILPRFNPLAEFVASDGHISGSVQLRFEGMSDQSDKDAAAEQYAKIKYEIALKAEAWLPLPERSIPTVLGVVNTLKESIRG
jgi:hypothetical protein